MRRFVSGIVACLLAAGVIVIGIAKTTQHAFSQGVAPYKWDANWQPEWLTILPIAKEAAAPILRGETGDPSYLLRLRQAHQALPVSVPRPITCLAFMDAAVSKSRSTVAAVRMEARESAQRSIECYEGRRVDGTVPSANRDEPVCRPNAAASAGLWIGSVRFTKPTDPDSILFLKQDAQPKRLRHAILCAMMENQHRRFVFQSESALRWNIALRERFIHEMEDAIGTDSDLSRKTCHFVPSPDAFSLRGWERYRDQNGAHRYARWPDGGSPGPGAWRSGPMVSAHAAIQPLRNRNTGLDCLLGAQALILEAVDAVLAGQAAGGTVGSQFNALHPVSAGARALFGLGIHLYALVERSFPQPHFDIRITPPGESSIPMHFIVIRVHIRSDRMNPPVGELDQRAGRLAGPINVADMVPGDHVYMENKFDYRTHYPEGAWNGENAIYMDKGQFAGLGVGLVSEIKLRTLLAQHYNEDPNDSRPDLPSMRAIPSDMEWTLIAAPSLFGAKDEAGQFANP